MIYSIGQKVLVGVPDLGNCVPVPLAPTRYRFTMRNHTSGAMQASRIYVNQNAHLLRISSVTMKHYISRGVILKTYKAIDEMTQCNIMNNIVHIAELWGHCYST